MIPLRPKPISDNELDAPTVGTLGWLLYNAFVEPFRKPIGILLASALVALMLWGYHGNLDLLGAVWDGWTGPGTDPSARARILPGIPWDQEWSSFWAGALLVVGIPALVIRFVFKMRLRDFGLGLPPPGRRRLALISALGLLVVAAGGFYVYAHNPAMAATYPIFRDFHDFRGVGEFALYELGYLPFFLAIEFIFRGYLLFGVYSLWPREGLDGVAGDAGRRFLVDFRILIPMLAYTAWHLGKPLPELWGTLVWGLVVSAIVLAIRSIWPIVAVHWLLNVWMDLVIWQGW